MRKIIAFETPDHQRFFNEDEARKHERRYDFGNQIDTAVRSEPQFARLDREMLIDYFMQHGSTLGKLADSPILPQRSFGSSSPAEEAERQVPVHKHTNIASEKPTTGILPHPSSPEGQRRMAESDKRAREIMTPPGDPMDSMVAELDRELAKG